MLVDHHCHLDFADFVGDRAGVIARARAAGVGILITIATRVRRFDEVLSIAEAYPNVFCSVGTHPHHASEESDVELEQIVALAAHPKVVAIGEAGLDYFYRNSTPEAQAEGFRKHIAAAQQTGLPLVVHTRNADADTATVLETAMQRARFAAVLHCFTGGSELAERGLDLGCYISFSGILTFKRSEALREIARRVPLERLLVETDAPYLAPGRHRGRRNEPAFVVETAAELARLKGIAPAELAHATTENFFRLYSKVPRAELGGMSMRITLLGTGSSVGVPRLGPVWGACDPGNPKNRRRRCALLVEQFDQGGSTSVLVDTPADLREQLLEAGVGQLDGVLYTHDHADHTHGIDDLRGVYFQTKQRVPIYADPSTRRTLEHRFAYCFTQAPGSLYPAILEAHDLRVAQPQRILGAGGPIDAIPILHEHGDVHSLGFRFGKVAYSPDVGGIPEQSVPLLQGLELWIVDALRPTPHPSHFSVSEVLGWIERLGVRRAVLTHMTIELDYEKLRQELPAHVQPGYDGMVIELA